MAPQVRPTLLVLWDIDHTLIETRGVGRVLYARAFEAVTGQPLRHDVDPSGRTEPSIFAETLDRHDLSLSPKLQARYADELAAQYRQHADELRRTGRALPGALEALSALAVRPEVLQSVLTGNLRAVAIQKLEAFDLGTLIEFDVGAYGEDGDQRSNLVRIAQDRACEATGVSFDRRSTVLVGDTSQDVLTGKEGGAAVVAVATGRESVMDLKSAGATSVLSDLTSARDVIAAIMAA